MSTSVRAAVMAAHQVKADLCQILQEDYPPGTQIEWAGGRPNSRCIGIVVSNGYTDRVKVRNAKTKAEYWITADKII